MFTDEELKTAIKNYIKARRNKLDSHIEYTISKKQFNEVIKAAAEGVDSNNGVHSHQRRIGRIKLKDFALKIATIEIELKHANNFDVLYDVIANLKAHKIGALAIYDTALRIAHTKKDCMPDKIYLHTGTRVGAKKLVPSLANKKYIYKSDLPKVLSNSDLTPAELEDLLCHISSNKGGCITRKDFKC